LASLISSGKVDVQKLVPVLGTMLTALRPLVTNAKVKQGIDLIVSMAGSAIPASSGSEAQTEQPSGGGEQPQQQQTGGEEPPPPDGEQEGGGQ
jgi:hypothetical protein